LIRRPRRLRLAPLAPAVAALGVAALLLWQLLPGLIQEASAHDLYQTLRLIAPDAAAAVRQSPEALQTWVEQAAGRSGLRVTVIAEDGRVIAESTRKLATLGTMSNHADRPEVMAALARGEGWAERKSATTGDPYVYAARTLPGKDGRLIVLRLAQPLDALKALSGHLAAALGLALAAALAVGVGLGWWNDRRLFRPLSDLAAGAGELANGRYQHRVEIPDDDELSALGLALNRLGAAIERQLAVIEQERDHLRAILASMSEGVLVVGADRRAQLTNPAFQRLFGLSGDVAGRSVLEILRRPEVERLVEATLKSAERGGGVGGAPRDLGLEIEIEGDGAERRTIQVQGDVLFDEQLLAGAVLVARDATAVKRLDEMRRDFVANVSHELKTPLSAIRGFAETLRDGALAEPETAARFIGRILEHCRRLQALLDDLLTLGRLESVGERASRAPVDLLAIARRAMEGVAPAAEERHVEMTFQAPPAEEGPMVLTGDAEGLERMLTNLLANAIKYNRPDGAVHLRIRRQPAPAGGVSDRGRRHRHRHSGRGAPPAVRALLPGRQRSLARRGGHRPRPVDRQARRANPRRPGRGPKPRRPGLDVSGQPAGLRYEVAGSALLGTRASGPQGRARRPRTQEEVSAMALSPGIHPAAVLPGPPRGVP
jgi:two-component system phosphate regulon sensor histidine kinase PhoR